jgi:hypothetical protein
MSREAGLAQVLYDKLVNQIGVGNRIYYEIAPNNAERPFVVFNIVSVAVEQQTNFRDQIYLVDFNIYSDMSSRVWNCADAIEKRLVNLSAQFENYCIVYSVMYSKRFMIERVVGNLDLHRGICSFEMRIAKLH